MSESFRPWEIPTRGKKPPLELVYDDGPDGRRIVLNNSPWVLLVTRANGFRHPLDRIGGAVLEAGDAVSLPESETVEVESSVVFKTQLESIRDYHRATARRFDEDAAMDRSYHVPERWWWYRRETADGLVLHIHQASTNARLSVSVIGDMDFQGSWCYPNHGDGWRAVMGWNGWGDPPDGWIRHLETARRRKDGTAETEYVLASEGGAPWANEP